MTVSGDPSPENLEHPQPENGEKEESEQINNCELLKMQTTLGIDEEMSTGDIKSDSERISGRIPGLPRSQKKQSRRQEFKMKRTVRRRELNKNKRLKEQQLRHEIVDKLTPEQKDEYFAAINARRRAERDHAVHLCQSGPLRIVIDCIYADKMSAVELKSLGKQILFAYKQLSTDLTAVTQLHLSSIDSKIKDMWSCFGVKNWTVNFHENDFLSIFEDQIDKLVILSPDADAILENVDAEHIYIVGGLVDRTVAKMQTKFTADQSSIQSYRLPIRENIERRTSATSCILTVNQVVLILDHIGKGGSWPEAFERFMPQRKVKLKTNNNNLNNNNSPLDVEEEEEAILEELNVD